MKKNKTATHQAIQDKIESFFPPLSCRQELPFPTIRRVADIVHLQQKLVFEVQYSPISLQELQNRQRDYYSQGYYVIWILHDHTFNQSQLSPAENYLLHFPHYFTNIDTNGEGVIYDQPSIIEEQSRRIRLPQKVVNFTYNFSVFPKEQTKLPEYFQKRFKFFNIYFKDDYIDGVLSGESLHLIHDINSKFPYNELSNFRSFGSVLKKSYKTAFLFLLKKVFFSS